ncbi:cytochrome P450 [Micromonospora sp. C95]|uniref:cytochrome P450 family protein n=1 Tax=Micromonospora sp. C95 TaxID=2824882 RepID=UPI001B3845E8|nr:cytochrome P450 [Micromonospora sp. C95]MBQ1023940.1 cytochrome P450 [Micromonospora sp. C95]
MADQQEPTDHDLFADGTPDPYQAYAAFREQAPVRRVIQPDGLPVYYISGYAEARAALNDDRLAHHLRHAAPAMAAAGMPLDPQRINFGGAHMLHADPPEHPRLRKLVSRAFTAARVEALRPAVQRLVDELIDAMPQHGEADLVTALADPLPVLVICELLGVPTADRTDFRRWSNATLGSDFATDLPMSRAEGKRLLREYMTDLVVAKRKDLDPADPDGAPDLISALIQLRLRDGDDALTEEELVATSFILLIAGQESTVNFLSLAMLGITTDPALQRGLRERPESVRHLFEELLRYDGPVQRSVIRTALSDIQLGGVTIPAGHVVCVGLAAANRDECRFPEAAKVDPERTDNAHLGFGHGRHFCLGAPLARLEGHVALTALAQRFDVLELAVAAADLRWRRSFQRGLESLPVRLSAADAFGGRRPTT